MPTTAEGATGRRLALVIATGSYGDPTLAKLRAPGSDASDLASVLEDAAVGGFEVEMLLDAPTESLRRRIAQFCAQVGPHDLALVYLSCHGVLDDRGRLYYATVDTDRTLLSATAVPSAWLNEQLEDCRGRRQILVLDCCHSGAFAKGAKGEGDLALGERFEGRGRVVLTGSRGTEYSFEHDRVVGDDSASSVFTSALVDGLRSGDADRDGDGMVTVGELYDYAYEAVRTKEARQTPTLWTYGAEGDLLVAQSPRGPIVKPAPLPEDLLMLLESARSRVREGAVAELADLLKGPDAGRALTAREELERVAAEDVPSVAGAARTALDADPATGQQKSPPPAPAPPSRPPSSHPASPADPPSPNRRRRIAIGAGALIATAIVLAIVLLGGGGGGGESPAGPSEFTLSGSPHGIAVGEGATWVARYEAGQVSRIGSSSEPESIDVGSHPTKVVASEGSVWVDVEDGERLARIDPDTHEVTAHIDLESGGCGGCQATELAIARNTLWVSSANRRTITKFSLTTGEQLGEPLRPGLGFTGIFAIGDDAAWAVANDELSPPISSVVRIGIESGEPDRNPLQRDSYFGGVAYGDGTVWIADAGSGRSTVNAYDPETEKVTKDVTLRNGVYADDIAVAGDSVIVWNPNGGWLSTIDARTTEVVTTKRLPGFPWSHTASSEKSDLAVDGDFAWVTDPGRNSVYKVKY